MIKIILATILLLVVMNLAFADVVVYDPSGGTQTVCVFQQGVLTCF